MKTQKSGLNRRQFIGSVAATSALAMTCGGNGDNSGKVSANTDRSMNASDVEYNLTTLLPKAPDGQEIKAAVIGCGGRGGGAANNFLDAGDNLKIVALADVFPDRLNRVKESLKKRGNDVPDENCFIGLDAYEKVLDMSDVNYVILATPPYFRPYQFEAAINAKKHVFMEKPVAVDPVGAKIIMASAERAKQFDINVACGTQRRHQHNYVAIYKEIMGGAIGDIVSANVYWNGGQLWSNKRGDGWSDLEWMIRDWVNWAWLSGDHIVEQHVHNLDVAYWFLGVHPDKAVGFGSRHRRPTGDQYDNFSIDFEYDDGRHMHSMCRQIHGCKNNVSEYFTGTKGFAVPAVPDAPHTFLKNSAGEVIWTYDDAVNAGLPKKPISAYQQEHVDLIWAIRTGNKIVEAENTATSTLTAIMGRTSAYTGQEVTWEQMMNSDDRLGPEPKELAFENKYVWVEDPPIPKPGSKKEENA